MWLEISLVTWICSECGLAVKRFFGKTQKMPRGVNLVWHNEECERIFGGSVG